MKKEYKELSIEYFKLQANMSRALIILNSCDTYPQINCARNYFSNLIKLSKNIQFKDKLDNNIWKSILENIQEEYSDHFYKKLHINLN